MTDHQTSDQAFLKRLSAIGKLTGFDADDDILALYDRTLSELGYPQLCQALDKIAMDLGPGKSFPSIRCIREVITGERKVDAARVDASAAKIAASNVISAVSKFGSVNGEGEKARARLEEIRQYVGDLGWECIRTYGSWNSFCEALTWDNLGTTQAQIRDLGQAILDRRAAGITDLAPGLPEPHRTPSQIANGDLRPISADDTAHLTRLVTRPRGVDL